VKTCKTCILQKPLDEFYSGFSVCKPCHKARSREWRNNNIARAREIERESARRAWERDSAKLRTKWQNWVENNPIKYRESVAKSGRKWSAANLSKKRAAANLRRARRIQATPAWINHEKVAEFYFAADFLGMVTGEWYHVDHVVPIQSDVVCGLHWEGNLQVLSAPENLKKSNQFYV
jgi:hypothetical protein